MACPYKKRTRLLTGEKGRKLLSLIHFFKLLALLHHIASHSFSLRLCGFAEVALKSTVACTSLPSRLSAPLMPKVVLPHRLHTFYHFLFCWKQASLALLLAKQENPPSVHAWFHVHHLKLPQPVYAEAAQNIDL